MAKHIPPFRLVKSDRTVLFNNIFRDVKTAQSFVDGQREQASLKIGDHFFGIDAKNVTGKHYEGPLNELTSIIVLRVGENGIHIDPIDKKL